MVGGIEIPTFEDAAPVPSTFQRSEAAGSAQAAEASPANTDLGVTAGGWLDSAQGWLGGLWDSAYSNVNSADLLRRFDNPSPEYLAGYLSGNRFLGSLNGAMYNSDIGRATRDYWFATPGRSATLGGLMGGVNALVPVVDVNRLPENMRSAFGKGELVVGSLAMAETLATGVPTLIDKAKNLYKTLTRPPVPPALAPALAGAGGRAGMPGPSVPSSEPADVRPMQMAAGGRSDSVSPPRKLGGRFTEPKLPPKTVASEGEVSIEHYTRSGDHGPPHLHVKGGGPETKIGQAGKPIEGAPELTPAQQAVVEDNRAAIRRALDRIMRYARFQHLDE
jgi:hypothetical protein